MPSGRPLPDDRRKAIAKFARDSRMTYAEIARRFNTSVSVVSSIARANGIERNDMWTDDEIAFLRDNYQTRGATGCADALGKHTFGSVAHKASSLGLKSGRRRGGGADGE